MLWCEKWCCWADSWLEDGSSEWRGTTGGHEWGSGDSALMEGQGLWSLIVIDFVLVCCCGVWGQNCMGPELYGARIVWGQNCVGPESTWSRIEVKGVFIVVFSNMDNVYLCGKPSPMTSSDSKWTNPLIIVSNGVKLRYGLILCSYRINIWHYYYIRWILVLWNTIKDHTEKQDFWSPICMLDSHFHILSIIATI